MCELVGLVSESCTHGRWIVYSKTHALFINKYILLRAVQEYRPLIRL